MIRPQLNTTYVHVSVFLGIFGVFCKGCWWEQMSVDVVQSVVLQIEVISISCTLYGSKQIRVCPMALFSHVIANTGRIHIHDARTGKRERERRRGQERRVGISFFPPLFSPSLPE